MEELARRFRRVAERRGGLRYPRELRQVALEYVERAGAAGMSQEAAVAALGLSKATLCRWRQEREGSAGISLHEVKVVESAITGPVLVLPCGVRVEGLSVEDLVRVLGGLR